MPRKRLATTISRSSAADPEAARAARRDPIRAWSATISSNFGLPVSTRLSGRIAAALEQKLLRRLSEQGRAIRTRAVRLVGVVPIRVVLGIENPVLDRDTRHASRRGWPRAPPGPGRSTRHTGRAPPDGLPKAPPRAPRSCARPRATAAAACPPGRDPTGRQRTRRDARRLRARRCYAPAGATATRISRVPRQDLAKHRPARVSAERHVGRRLRLEAKPLACGVPEAASRKGALRTHAQHEGLERGVRLRPPGATDRSSAPCRRARRPRARGTGSADATRRARGGLPERCAFTTVASVFTVLARLASETLRVRSEAGSGGSGGDRGTGFRAQGRSARAGRPRGSASQRPRPPIGASRSSTRWKRLDQADETGRLRRVVEVDLGEPPERDALPRGQLAKGPAVDQGPAGPRPSSRPSRLRRPCRAPRSWERVRPRSGEKRPRPHARGRRRGGGGCRRRGSCSSAPF